MNKHCVNNPKITKKRPGFLENGQAHFKVFQGYSRDFFNFIFVGGKWLKKDSRLAQKSSGHWL